MKEIVLHTGKSPLGATLLHLDTEAVPYQLMIFIGQEHRSLDISSENNEFQKSTFQKKTF